MTDNLAEDVRKMSVDHARHANSAVGEGPVGAFPPLAEQCIDFDTIREHNPDMDATEGATVYAVEHDDYSDRCTEVLFTTEALAREYIAARIAAAKEYDRVVMDWDSDYEYKWSVVTYQLWSALPVVPKSLNVYDDVPGLET